MNQKTDIFGKPELWETPKSWVTAKLLYTGEDYEIRTAEYSDPIVKWGEFTNNWTYITNLKSRTGTNGQRIPDNIHQKAEEIEATLKLCLEIYENRTTSTIKKDEEDGDYKPF